MADLFDFESMPRFETNRLVLREIDPVGDLRQFYELLANPAVANHTDTGPFQSEEEAAEVLGWVTAIYEERRGMRWAIVDKSDEGHLIGTCGFNQWHRWNNSADIGYDLQQARWGAGLMGEALTPILRFGFERMGLNRIEADVTVGNERSIRVLEKLGFVAEGVMRQRGYWRGEYHDLQYFGLLKADWKP